MKSVFSLGKNTTTLVVILSIAGFLLPSTFIHLKAVILPLLVIIMVSVGLSLEKRDFNLCLEKKINIFVIAALKPFLLTTLAFLLTYFSSLNKDIMMGIILVGCCPGGTAAGLMSSISRANVSLTIILTGLTTILSPIIIPTLINTFLFKQVQIPIVNTVGHLFLVVGIPVIVGFAINSAPWKFKIPKNYLNCSSKISIALIIAYIVSINANNFSSLPINFYLIAVIFNLLSFLIGYLISTLVFDDVKSRLATTFEYGIFDTAITVYLTGLFFSERVAIPAAIISITQNIIGLFICSMSTNKTKYFIQAKKVI